MAIDPDDVRGESDVDERSAGIDPETVRELVDDSQGVPLTELQLTVNRFTDMAAQTERQGNPVRADQIRLLLCARLQHLAAQAFRTDDPDDQKGRGRLRKWLEGDSMSDREKEIRQFITEQCRDQLLQVDPDRLRSEVLTESDQHDSSTAAATESGAFDDDELGLETLTSRAGPPERSLSEFVGDRVRLQLLNEVRQIETQLEYNLSDTDHANLHSLLFWGPEGTGKSMGAEVFTHTLNELGYDFQFVPVDGGAIKHHHFGKSQKRLQALLEWADETGPSVVFIDEIDEISHRDGQEGVAAITNKLLGITSGPNAVEDVVIVGATNLVDRFDPAMLSRFVPIWFPDPDPEARRTILLQNLDDEPVRCSLAREDLSAVNLEGFSGRGISQIAKRAKSLGRHRDDGIEIELRHVATAVREVRQREQLVKQAQRENIAFGSPVDGSSDDDASPPC